MNLKTQQRTVSRRLLSALALSAAIAGCTTTALHADQYDLDRRVGVVDTGPPPASDPSADARPETRPDPRPEAATTRDFRDVDSAVRAVRDAKNADEAVDAYSAGLALDRNNVPLQEAYVRRLVDLSAPQVAEPAAVRLVGISPNSSLAWAVIAFAEAKRGNMPDALTDVCLAARKLVDDPFVQRTAGELLAWYDNTPRKPPLAEGVKADLDTVRKDMAGRKTFAEAFDKATTFYKNTPHPDDSHADAAPPDAPADRATTAGSSDGPAATSPDRRDLDVADAARAAEDRRDSRAGYSYDSGSYDPAPPSEVVEEDTTYTAGPAFYYGYEPAWYYTPSFVFIGGDWGWCYRGGWHDHDRDWGRRYEGGYGRGGYGGGGYGRDSARGGNYDRSRGSSYSSRDYGSSGRRGSYSSASDSRRSYSSSEGSRTVRPTDSVRSSNSGSGSPRGAYSHDSSGGTGRHASLPSPGYTGSSYSSRGSAASSSSSSSSRGSAFESRGSSGRSSSSGRSESSHSSSSPSSSSGSSHGGGGGRGR